MCGKKCCKNKCCDCVVIINRTPPPTPIPGIVYPPNTNTLAQVIEASCGVSSQNRRRCSSIVTELYKLFNELQYEYRIVNADGISRFYAEGAVVSFNSTLLLGRSSILSGFIQPQLGTFTSVNPDLTTLLYQIVNCDSVVQYGTYTVSSYTGTTVVATTTYTVLTTLVREEDRCNRNCGRWVIVSEVISTLLA